MDMMQMDGMGSGMGMMMVMVLFWVLVIGALVWLVWWALRGRSDSQRRGGENAESILKERYARGEIDRATYEEMREDLR